MFKRDPSEYANTDQGNPDGPAKRFNKNKPRMSKILTMPKFVTSLDSVMREGDEKYGEGNWKKGGRPADEYYDSALRHMIQARETSNGIISPIGKNTINHLAAAAWNLGVLIELGTTINLDGDSE